MALGLFDLKLMKIAMLLKCIPHTCDLSPHLAFRPMLFDLENWLYHLLTKFVTLMEMSNGSFVPSNALFAMEPRLNRVPFQKNCQSEKESRVPPPKPMEYIEQAY